MEKEIETEPEETKEELEEQQRGLTKQDVEELLDSIKIREGEFVRIENKNFGVSVELLSRKFDAVQLSNMALDILSKTPIELKKFSYIG
jgi:hypothetical protein